MNINCLSKDTIIKLIDSNGGNDLILSDKMIPFLNCPFSIDDDSNYFIGSIILKVKEGVFEIPYRSINKDNVLELDINFAKLLSKERLNDIENELNDNINILKQYQRTII